MNVRQIVYYKDFSLSNNPIGLNGKGLIGDFVLNNIVYDDIQIDAFPGAKLQINGQDIIIGDVGVYSIMYKEGVHIATIRVSQGTIDVMNQTGNKHLIITLLKKDN